MQHNCVMAEGPFDPAMFDPAIFDTGEEPSFASVDWTGVERRLSADPAAVDEIRRRIAELDIAVERAGLTNAEQYQAKAITTALRTLVETPQPEWRSIIALLTSQRMVAILAALQLGEYLTDLLKLIVG